MVTRVISGAVLAVATIAALVLGGLTLFIVCGLVSLVGLFELYRVYNIHKSPMGLVGYLGVLAIYACVYFNVTTYLTGILICILMVIMAVYVGTFTKYKSDTAMAAVFGVLYAGLMMSYIYQVRVMDKGIYLVWLIFICSWVSDTFAYFTGMLLGKHKMSPKLSPKKTVEGLFGGIFASGIVGAVYGAIFSDMFEFTLDSMLVFAVVGICGAALSVVGDLVASGIKRDHEVKDYGRLIPGHGGVLDRFDSVIFTAPAVFWIVSLFM